MSRKDRERAEKEGSFRERQERQGEQRYHCLFPGCPRTFWKEEGKPNLCNHHKQFVGDLLFALNHLKSTEEVGPQDGPKIFVPKPGMEDQAIKEAARAARKGS